MLATNEIDVVVLLRDQIDVQKIKEKEKTQVLEQQEFEARQAFEEQRLQKFQQHIAMDLFRSKVWLG